MFSERQESIFGSNTSPCMMHVTFTESPDLLAVVLPCNLAILFPMQERIMMPLSDTTMQSFPQTIETSRISNAW